MLLEGGRDSNVCIVTEMVVFRLKSKDLLKLF